MSLTSFTSSTPFVTADAKPLQHLSLCINHKDLRQVTSPLPVNQRVVTTPVKLFKGATIHKSKTSSGMRKSSVDDLVDKIELGVKRYQSHKNHL